MLFDVDRQTEMAAGAKDKLAKWKDHFPDAASQVALLRYAWRSNTEAPKDPSLIKALREATPRATRLVEVAEEVSQSAFKSKYFPESLQVDKLVSDVMKDLPFTKKPDLP